MFKKTGIVEIEDVYCSCGEKLEEDAKECPKCKKKLVHTCCGGTKPSCCCTGSCEEKD